MCWSILLHLLSLLAGHGDTPLPINNVQLFRELQLALHGAGSSVLITLL
jgi:hypothetical protein